MGKVMHDVLALLYSDLSLTFRAEERSLVSGYFPGNDERTLLIMGT